MVGTPGQLFFFGRQFDKIQLLGALLVSATPFPNEGNSNTSFPLEDSSATSIYRLSKRANVATIYYDTNGVVRTIFNMNVVYATFQALSIGGLQLEQNVMGEALRWLRYSSGFGQWLDTATSYAQVGQHWQNVIRGEGGVGTISFTITVAAQFHGNIRLLVLAIQYWLTQGISYNSVGLVQVQDATQAGIAPPDGKRAVEIGTIKIRQASSGEACKIVLQDTPFILTGGDMDLLLPDPITC